MGGCLRAVVLLGGAGGRIEGGRVRNYRAKWDRQMCRLFLSMMDKMDVRLPKFGDASNAMEEVWELVVNWRPAV